MTSLGASIFGRTSEQRALHDFLAVPPDSAALVLEGEAGAGKTTLWHAAVSEARQAGFTVLLAAPAEREVALPFAALGDLLDPVIDAHLPDLARPQRDAVGSALHRSAAPEPVTPVAVARGVLDVLQRAAGEGPLLIAVDDVQWLDRSSAGVLEFAFRRLSGVGVRILLARRTDQPPHSELPLGLDRAPLARAVQRLTVAPLSPGDLHHLLLDRLQLKLPRPRLLELHRNSGGNPFYALEIARLLADAPLDDARGPLPVPDSVSVLLGRRLDALSPAARLAVLLVASSTHAAAATVERAAGGTDGLDEAVVAGVLRIDGGRLRCSHPLLASVAVATASPWARRDAHRLLAAATTDAEERAAHLAVAIDEADAAVAAELDHAAGLAAARGAPEVAADLLERAAALTPAGDVDKARQRRLTAADHHEAAGDTERARRTLTSVVAEMQAGQARADVLRHLADLGDHFLESIQLCEQALAEAAGEPVITARIHLQLATLTSVAGDLNRSLEHLRAAGTFAEQASDEALVAVTIAGYCSMQMYLGLPYPREEMERAIEIERRVGGIALYQHPTVRFGTMLANADEHDAARPLLHATLSRFEQEGTVWQLGPLFRLADLELRAGNWGEATRMARRSREIAQNAGLMQERSMSLMINGLVDAHLGDLAAARDQATQAFELAVEASDSGYAVRAAGVLGFTELSAGRLDAALVHLEPASAELRRLGVGELSIHHVVNNEIEALVGVGRLDAALTVIDYVDEKGRPTRRSWNEAIAARGRALVAGARGDHDTARAHIATALAAHERLGQPFELGRTLLALGIIERRAKQRAAARRALTRALDLFDHLGAAVWAEHAAAELARIPGRTRAADGLTATERQVADLVAAGLSNRETAARLFVSVRAVEANLSRVYAKLHVRSRTQLAGRLAEAEADARR